jgi:hypothetical protein
MVGRVLDRRVLLGADAKRLDGDRLAGVCIEVALREPWRVDGAARILSVRIDSVDAGQRAIFVVERAVLVEMTKTYLIFCLSVAISSADHSALVQRGSESATK